MAGPFKVEVSSETPCTVIVAPRDTFTRLGNCLYNVLKHTPARTDVICLVAGAPEIVRRGLEACHKDKVRFIFKEGFMTDAQLRNLGLRETKTKLAVCIDSDVFVRPGWLEPLLRCQHETGALMVTPIVLDRQSLIHTAGNYLYITEERGKKFCVPELQYANRPFTGKTNIPRHEIDYAEIHCHLVEVESALQLGIYDENIREGHCMDSGLTIQKAGRKTVLEPGSTVYLHYPALQDRLDDIPLYRWKWDYREIVRGFAYLEKKWGIDFLSKSGIRRHIVLVNNRIGFFTLLRPCGTSIFLDRLYMRGKSGFGQLLDSLRGLKSTALGHGARKEELGA
jgi:hypothetical protein